MGWPCACTGTPSLGSSSGMPFTMGIPCTCIFGIWCVNTMPTIPSFRRFSPLVCQSCVQASSTAHATKNVSTNNLMRT